MRTRPRILYVIALAAVSLAAGGVLGQDAMIGPIDSTAADIKQSIEISKKPVRVESVEGSFQVVFPSGCAKLQRRITGEETRRLQRGSRVVQVSHVNCDRWESGTSGCWVKATIQIDGPVESIVTDDNVMRQVRNVLSGLNASIEIQRPISKALPDDEKVEGIEIFGLGPDKVGQVWVRGLLYYDDIYVLVAWNKNGGLWDDLDYLDFFNSFLPYID